jgi:predicted dehydrogenase
MNSNQIGLGIIGLSAKGGWASMAHIPALATLPQFDVRALTASTPESAKEAADKYGTAFWSSDPSQLVTRPEVDLVVVSVKVIQHYGLVEAALNAGKHVPCEWPLGKTLEETKALAALAKAKGVRGFVGLQARFVPALSYIRDLIEDGYVGEVLSTSVIASAPGGRGETARAGRFYLDRANGGGMLNIPFGHTIDGLCWLFGELGQVRPTVAIRRLTSTIIETGEVAPVTSFDQVALSGVFANGAVASIHYRSGIAHGTGFHWEINGTKGDLIVTAPMGHLQLAPVKIRGVTGEEKDLRDLPVPAKYLPGEAELSSRATAVAGLYKALERDLRGGTHTVASFDDAVARHEMIEAIAQAGG